MRTGESVQSYPELQSELIDIISQAKLTSTRSINAVMVATYWLIGRRIVEHEQQGSHRAGYGNRLMKVLASDLTRQFGRGFGWRNLTQMRAFYLGWPMKNILQTPSAISASESKDLRRSDEPSNSQHIVTATLSSVELLSLASRFALPWSAYVALLSVRNTKAREFYEEEAIRCGWSIRQLERQINTNFYERSSLSRDKLNKRAFVAESEIGDHFSPQEAIRDPFVLEFLDLKDDYSESDLEEGLIQRLMDFLLELGDDFALVARQRRLRLDNNWFRIDLLLYHRLLRCLVVVDLKVGRFGHADAGQMHMYLNYARNHWMKPGENPPVGLILCTSKGAQEAHYALDGLPNTVLAAEYTTTLPEPKLLEAQLRKSRKAMEQTQSRRSERARVKK